jgi:hypothetical protein
MTRGHLIQEMGYGLNIGRLHEVVARHGKSRGRGREGEGRAGHENPKRAP